ncbi:MAG: protelomerase family protein, partial [Crocosphaera sp.]
MNITPNKTIVQLIREPETVIEVGKKLLNSEDCSEVMAALVLMTGLKCELLLTATTFDLKTAYSVVFTDPTSSEEVSREIPTLTLAENVIKAINFIRNTIDTNHLDSRTINASFLPSVINAC